MPDRQPLLYLALALVLLAVVAPTADAQQWGQVIFNRAKEYAALALLSFIILQAAAIYVFSRFLELGDGVIPALVAPVLTVVLTVVAAIPLAFVLGVMPPLVAPLAGTAATFAAGGLAVKLLYGSSFGHGVLVFILASTVTLIASCIALVVIL